MDSSLNGSWTVETVEDAANDSNVNGGDQHDDSGANGADISLNSEYSLTSSNSSSAEVLSNGSSTVDNIDSQKPVEPIPPVAVEVNGVA